MEDKSASVSFMYHPVLPPRRGEWIAWLCAVMCCTAWLVLSLSKTPVFFVLKILAVVLFLIAAAISMSNWMDRHTVLKIDATGVAFENGLRKARLGWQEIQQVQVVTSSLGDKVRVLGETAHFDFRMLGEVTFGGKVKGQIGFREGEKILREIILSAGLKKKGEVDASCVYYARQ